MRKKIRKKQVLIFIVDVFLLYISLVLSLLIRRGSFPEFSLLGLHIKHFSIVFIIWLLVFYTAGFYRIDLDFGTLRYFKRLATGIAIAGGFSVLYFYGLPSVLIAPKTVIFILLFVFCILLWGWRYLYGRVWHGPKTQRVGVGIIGYSREVLDIIETLKRPSAIGYDVRFVYSDDDTTLPNLGSILALNTCEELGDTVARHDVSVIVLPDKRSLSSSISKELYDLIARQVSFVTLTDFYEDIFRLVPLNAISEIWFLENIDLKNHLGYLIVKDALDRILATLFFLLCIPFSPFVALIIKLESKGPVFFKQVRVGRLGNPFTMVKFRTMRVEGNTFAPTMAADGRITKFGSFLRSTRIDELPQLLNIIKGEMSFIGPRPERPEIAENLAKIIPYYQQRHLIKPGVTGWDQVSGEYHSPSIEDTRKKLQFDLYYLKNLSFALDFSIVFKTIMTVLHREGM